MHILPPASPLGLSQLQSLDVTGTIVGLADATFTSPSAFASSTAHSVTWLRSTLRNYQKLLPDCQASVIICDEDIRIPEELLETKCFFVVKNPKLIFAKLINAHFCPRRATGYHPTAVVDGSAQIGNDVYIGPYACVGPAIIGDGCSIGAHAIVEGHVTLGENVILHENVHIGSEGFGFIRDSNGTLVKFHHSGSVVIADGVEIYPFSNIDRATLGDTKIGRNSKIDHYCHIGHNSEIGDDTLICAGVILCGGVQVGDRCWIGPNSVIKEKVEVGDEVLIGLSSLVTKDVPDRQTWAGHPATPLDELVRTRNALRSLTQKT